MTTTATNHDFEDAAVHFRRMWASRNEQQGETTLRMRPGDTTDRYAMTRESLRSCLKVLRAAKARA